MIFSAVGLVLFFLQSLIVDSGIQFVNGELSAFRSKKDTAYRLSMKKLRGYTHFGKVVMVMKYYGDSPFI